MTQNSLLVDFFFFLPLDFDVEVYVYADDVIQYSSTTRCEVPQVA